MSNPPFSGYNTGGVGGVCANHATNPATAICQRCGDFICGYCLRPSADGAPFCPKCFNDDAGNYGELAWENPDEFGGIVPAFVHTLKNSLLSPNTFFTTVDPAGGYEGPILYILVCFAFAIGGSILSQIAQFTSIPGPNPMSEMMESSPEVAIAIGIGLVVFFPVWAVLGQLIIAAFVHLAAMMVGAANEGYEATFRLVSYSQGPQVITGAISAMVALLGIWHPVLFAIVSMIGGLINMGVGIYFYVLIVLGIRDVHDASLGRSIGAVGVLFGAFMLLGCLIMAIAMLMVMGVASAH